jgi:hypothetical protein
LFGEREVVEVEEKEEIGYPLTLRKKTPARYSSVLTMGTGI